MEAKIVLSECWEKKVRCTMQEAPEAGVIAMTQGIF